MTREDVKVLAQVVMAITLVLILLFGINVAN